MPTYAWAAEETMNPYGLQALWAEGDLISKGTLIILVFMSIGTWYFGIVKFIEQYKLFKQAKEAEVRPWSTQTMVAQIQGLNEASAFRYIAQCAADAAVNHQGNKIQTVEYSQWIDMSVQRGASLINSRLHGGLPFLGTVGSTAPFIGLFGTVWGIYHALTAIGMSGQASIDKVAGPVGEALIMTAIGLAVAVPAVLGYNFLIRRNKVISERVKHFGANLQMIILSGR
jgi:biopolymer transport protein ExbB